LTPATKLRSEETQAPLNVVNDEAVLEEDPLGHQKVDENGYLKGGRVYRCTTFTITGRGSRLYMVPNEVAVCLGIPDAFRLFLTHPNLVRIPVSEDEKAALLAAGSIPRWYKSRQFTTVTARSVFRDFGAHIVANGRKVIDDFYETRARAEGAVVGQLVDGNDYRPKPRKAGVNDTTWMFEKAKSAAEYNKRLIEQRRRQMPLNGVYEPHTNVMQFPNATQPTMVRWDKDNTEERTAADGLVIFEEVLESKPWVGCGLGAACGELGNGVVEWHHSLIDALEPEHREAVRKQVELERAWEEKW
jgi:chromatin structure-remodeling complex protein RSC7